MNAYAAAISEVDIHDVFSAPGTYFAKLKVWNGSEEFGDSGEVTVIADMGHFRLRR
jgi:hypothetical protein